MKSDFLICPKPDMLSFDEVHRLLWKANEANRRSGFVLRTSNLSGEELKKRIGEDGKCFVAFDGDRLIGTISVRFLQRNTWFAKGRVADYMLAAVDPEYQGKHVNTLLSEAVFQFVREQGCGIIELDTAESNIHAIRVYEHFGFRKVSFKANPGGDHYSVIMAKWLDYCPFSAAFCRIRYVLKRWISLLRFKPDKTKRFRF